MSTNIAQSRVNPSAGGRSGLSRLLFVGVVAISLISLTVTLLRYELRSQTGLIKKLDVLNVTSEHTVGAWLSGILLLFVAIHAFDGYLSLRERQSKGAWGWALLSIVFLVLSADELGSFHERVGVRHYISPFPSLLALGLLLSPLLGFGLLRLWSEEAERPRVRLIVLALLLLGTVPIQEFLEGSRERGWVLAVLSTVEEGTELLAILILLRVCMTNTLGRFAIPHIPTFPTLEAVKLARPHVLFVGILMAPALAYFTASLADQQRGHPADWFAAGVFMFAALTACRRFYKHGDKIGAAAWTLAGLCVLGSLISVVGQPKYDPHIVVARINLRMAALCVVSILVCAAWIPSFKYATHRAAQVRVAAPIAAMASLGILGLFQTSLFFIYLLPQLMALLTYYGNFAVSRRPEPSTPRLGRPRHSTARVQSPLQES